MTYECIVRRYKSKDGRETHITTHYVINSYTCCGKYIDDGMWYVLHPSEIGYPPVTCRTCKNCFRDIMKLNA